MTRATDAVPDNKPRGAAVLPGPRHVLPGVCSGLGAALTPLTTNTQPLMTQRNTLRKDIMCQVTSSVELNVFSRDHVTFFTVVWASSLPLGNSQRKLLQRKLL